MTTNPAVPTYVQGNVNVRATSNLPVAGAGGYIGPVIDVVYKSDGTALTVKYREFTVAAGAGDHTIVSNVASKRILVLSYTLVATGAVTVRWETGTAGTFLTGGAGAAGRMPLTASEILQEQSPYGVLRTAVNEILNLNTDGGAVINGSLTYVEY